MRGPTRRRVLQAGALGSLSTVTGCLGALDGSGSEPTTDEKDAGTATATSTEESMANEPLPERGDDAFLDGVQTYEIQEANHVQSGTDLEFDTMPPTGGTHYGGVVEAGFYEDQQSLGALVHNLEHGHVVVYYDPDALTPEIRKRLEAYARREYLSGGDSHWARVVVVPNPEEDPGSPFVLTAWGAMLRLSEYDGRTAHAFLAEYLGRGPENPVR